MWLEVRGMTTLSQSFVQLWGKYVKGFDPAKHCIYCLKGGKEPLLHREMLDGDYELKSSCKYFYLFAMGRGDRSETNVHLVVRPQPGAVASIGSMYGVTFTIYDALALRVDRLPDGWLGLLPEFTRCRNFQFGVQAFGYDPVGGPEHPGNHSLLPKKVA